MDSTLYKTDSFYYAGIFDFQNFETIFDSICHIPKIHRFFCLTFDGNLKGSKSAMGILILFILKHLNIFFWSHEHKLIQHLISKPPKIEICFLKLFLKNRIPQSSITSVRIKMVLRYFLHTNLNNFIQRNIVIYIPFKKNTTKILKSPKINFTDEILLYAVMSTQGFYLE